MRTAVRQSSVDAYYAMTARGAITSGQRLVLAAFGDDPELELTRAELQEVTGMRSGSVCGRVFELVDLGVLEERPRRTCRVTGESSHALRLAKAQRELFAA